MKKPIGVLCIIIAIGLLLAFFYSVNKSAEDIKETESETEKLSTAVFAWHGLEENEISLLEKYGISLILLDCHHVDDMVYLKEYQVYYLAGDPDWGIEEMEAAVEKARFLETAGIVFDIEDSYAELADNLEKLNTDFPIYVCIPYWLDTVSEDESEEKKGTEKDQDLVERIISASDGVFVMNYYRGQECRHISYEYVLAQRYKKKIWSCYELQSPGTHDLKDYNTYYNEGLQAVLDNYSKEFTGTEVQLAYHNFTMLKELDSAAD